MLKLLRKNKDIGEPKKWFFMAIRLIWSSFGDKELDKLAQKIKGFTEGVIEHFGSENWDAAKIQNFVG